MYNTNILEAGAELEKFSSCEFSSLQPEPFSQQEYPELNHHLHLTAYGSI